jgi:hypothetical protein
VISSKEYPKKLKLKMLVIEKQEELIAETGESANPN